MLLEFLFTEYLVDGVFLEINANYNTNIRMRKYFRLFYSFNSHNCLFEIDFFAVKKIVHNVA